MAELLVTGLAFSALYGALSGKTIKNGPDVPRVVVVGSSGYDFFSYSDGGFCLTSLSLAFLLSLSSMFLFEFSSLLLLSPTFLLFFALFRDTDGYETKIKKIFLCLEKP